MQKYLINNQKNLNIEKGLSFIFKKNVLYTLCVLFILTLLVYIFRIQALTEDNSFGISFNQELINPNKGQIYLQDYALNSPKPLTVSNYSTKVIINPANLKKTIEQNNLNYDDIAIVLSSVLNYPFSVLKNKLLSDIKENTSSYYVLLQNIIPQMSSQLKSLLNTSFYRGSDYKKYNITNWLSYEDTESRVYPQRNLAAPLVGYMSDNYWALDDIKKEGRCPGLLENNKLFQSSGYKVGLTGLEAKYCSSLSGQNGLRGYKDPVDGNNIYLTIDYNLQKEAERINEQIIKENTNNKGGPKNVTSIIVEVNNPDSSKNGRVVAMASSPTFNPNEYSIEYEKNPQAFINYSSDIPYEAGSVLKPLMVTTMLNEYFKAKEENPTKTCNEDKRLCVGPNWTFNDTCGGKRYSSENILIKNYNNNCFSGDLGLKEVLRDSINTGIAEMSKNIKTDVLEDYYLNKYGFGSLTSLKLENESKGNVDSIRENSGYNINNAYFGFGQGFTNTPLQLIQGYIPIVSGGYKYPIKIIEDNVTNNGKLTINPESAKLVKGYMAATSYEGYRGQGGKLEINGYGNGSKTGTAQIARFNPILDSNGKVVLDESGKEKKEWCGYDCNSEKGLYEHTLIGFAPVNNPRFLVLIKVSEPRPFESTLTSANQVLKKPWQELMQYTLGYMQIEKEY
jgi:cell division protein FtsI/penicillin-binding protein 2